MNKSIFAVAVCLALSTSSAFAQINTRLDSLQRVHVNLRFGMFIHFNMNTFYPGWGENRVDPITFAPTNVDCGQWARAAVSAKIKYAILTTKHHDGFALWPSRQNAPNGLGHYTVMESAYPHDIVRMFVDSMRAYNIIPCFYFSGWDQASGIPGPYNFRPDTIVWSRYSTFVLGQITELLGGTYGQIPLFVFDGYSWDMGHKAFPIEIIRGLIKRLQPNCLILDHNGATPWEVDIMYFEEPLGIQAPTGNTIASCQGQTISGDWFWNSTAANLSQLKTLNDCLAHLTRLEPLYCNFVLNCPPNKTGIFDAAILTRLAEIGNNWSPNPSRPAMPVQPPQLDRPFTPVSATATSANSSAFNAIDNTNDFSGSSHTQTLWTSTSALPQSVTLDLGAVRDSVDMLMYQPRRFGSTVGNITSYRIYVSTNGTTFTQITAGTSSSGTWGTWPGDSTIKWARFAQQSARYVRLEAVAANGSASNLINDNDSRITYHGWYYSGGRGLGDYNDDGHFSTVAGDSCTYTFNGTGIDYLSERYSDMGNVDVYIDGVFRQNVNLYVNGARQVQQTVYTISGLAKADHTIKIVNRSTAYACVDAFRLIGADSTSTFAVINTITVGAYLPYSQMVSAVHKPVSRSSPLSGTSVRKAIGVIMLDKWFKGNAQTVAVYDLTGKLVGMKKIRKNSVDLRKDFGISNRVCIVKVKL